MQRRFLLLSLITLLFFSNSNAQEEAEVEARLINYLSISYQFFAPGGDLADRFGVGNIIGADYNVKLENNFEFGIGGGFIFGNQVNNTEQMLHGMRTSNDQILDDNYKYAEVFFFQRGFDNRPRDKYCRSFGFSNLP